MPFVIMAILLGGLYLVAKSGAEDRDEKSKPPQLPPNTFPAIPPPSLPPPVDVFPAGFDPSDPFYVPQQSAGQPTSFRAPGQAPDAEQFSPEYLRWVIDGALTSLDPETMRGASDYLEQAQSIHDSGRTDSGIADWSTYRWGPKPYINALRVLANALEASSPDPSILFGGAGAIANDDIMGYNAILANIRNTYPETAAVMSTIGNYLAGTGILEI